MHRLEPVADIRQRPPDDHAHGVVEVGLLDLVLQIHRLPPVGRAAPAGMSVMQILSCESWHVRASVLPSLVAVWTSGRARRA